MLGQFGQSDPEAPGVSESGKALHETDSWPSLVDRVQDYWLERRSFAGVERFAYRAVQQP
jgi:hypothetical protein